jgi:molecular chaperone GrpE
MSSTEQTAGNTPEPTDPIDPNTPEVEAAAEAAGDNADTGARTEERPSWNDPRNTRIEMLERMLAEREQTLQSYIRAHKKSEQDFESFKQRLERDREREVTAAKVKLVEKLLDVEDNLERTIEAATRTQSIDSLVEGARLVHRMFRERLADLGLERVDPTGQLFDPTSMEALGMVPVNDPARDNTVVLTMRAGYRVGETEIRPALVQVGKFLS